VHLAHDELRTILSKKKESKRSVALRKNSDRIAGGLSDEASGTNARHRE